MVVAWLPLFLHPPFPISLVLLSLFVVLMFVFSFTHGAQTLGNKSISVFFGITVLVTFVMEWLGTNFGFPFGHYYYTHKLGPLILGVPIVVPVQWFNMLYVCYAMANIIFTHNRRAPILKRTEKIESTKFLYVLPQMVSISIVVGLFMVAWDFINDAFMVGVGAWLWTNPSEFFGLAYYGVPLSNYIGWLFTSSVIVLFFELYRYHWQIALQWVNHSVAESANILIVGPYLFAFIFQATNGVFFGVFPPGSPMEWGPVVLSALTMGIAVLVTYLSYRLLIRRS